MEVVFKTRQEVRAETVEHLKAVAAEAAAQGDAELACELLAEAVWLAFGVDWTGRGRA